MTLSLISAVPKCHYTLMVKELFRILHLNLLSNLSFLPAGVGVADGVRAKGRGRYEVRHDTWKAAVNNDSSILKRYEGNPYMCLWLGFTFEQKDCSLSFVRDVIYLYGLKNKLRDAFDLFVLIFNNRF